jgi:hypothetical protein
MSAPNDRDFEDFMAGNPDTLALHMAREVLAGAGQAAFQEAEEAQDLPQRLDKLRVREKVIVQQGRLAEKELERRGEYRREGMRPV